MTLIHMCSLTLLSALRPKEYLNCFVLIHDTKYDRKTLIGLKMSKYGHKTL